MIVCKDVRVLMAGTGVPPVGRRRSIEFTADPSLGQPVVWVRRSKGRG
jgi:hypothetical protein